MLTLKPVIVERLEECVLDLRFDVGGAGCRLWDWQWRDAPVDGVNGPLPVEEGGMRVRHEVFVYLMALRAELVIFAAAGESIVIHFA
jgi:hypothetical protein